jgi:hypothetical protein
MGKTYLSETTMIREGTISVRHMLVGVGSVSLCIHTLHLLLIDSEGSLGGFFDYVIDNILSDIWFYSFLRAFSQLLQLSTICLLGPMALAFITLWGAFAIGRSFISSSSSLVAYTLAWTGVWCWIVVTTFLNYQKADQHREQSIATSSNDGDGTPRLYSDDTVASGSAAETEK